MRLYCWILVLCSFLGLSKYVYAGIHNVPIIIQAAQLRPVLLHPLVQYRLFRNNNGAALPIPFQIDQKDKYSDYILESGKNPNTKSSNGLFNAQDELCIMGNDVGIKQVPTKWDFKKPDILYEIDFSLLSAVGKSNAPHEGAVYLGIYYKDAPPLAKETYVRFDLDNAQIITSRYRYLFNSKNYLVVRGIDVEKPQGEEQIIMSSAVYMRLDMKYFLTLNLGHSDIESELDAYKIGPVRVIARVNFDYKILKMKFDLGMYTEVSFFSNSVNLPAVIDNPLDGKKSLNKGSYFYYGLALVDNPKDLEPQSNMPDFKGKGGFFSFKEPTPQGFYWASAKSEKYAIYLEFQPSKQMEKDGNIPYMYVESVGKEDLQTRKNGPLPLGESPVNVAVSFDLDNFRMGVHQVAFRVFIENNKAESVLEEFKTLKDWRIGAQRLDLGTTISKEVPKAAPTPKKTPAKKAAPAKKASPAKSKN